MTGIFLSTTSFLSMSPGAQSEVIRAVGLDGISPLASAAIGAVNAIGTDEPVELTIALVRKLTDKLSEKTLTALKVIAQSDGPQFHMKDVIAATDGANDYMDMRGVWAALTRRTRSILNESDADLIWWDDQQIHDSRGNYVDHVGVISKLTHQSLRSHFGYQ